MIGQVWTKATTEENIFQEETCRVINTDNITRIVSNSGCNNFIKRAVCRDVCSQCQVNNIWSYSINCCSGNSCTSY